jgi:hypothetical protein
MVQVQAHRLTGRQIRLSLRLKRDGEARKKVNLGDSTLTRKSSQGVIWITVPQTDTGRWVEDTKAFERTLAKELGKITP